MSPRSPRLFLIDTFGLIFRAFYGRARAAVPSMRTSRGTPTEAIYIFTTMLRRLVKEHKPEYLAAVWEGEGPTFRDEIFTPYKANRTEMPTELAQQLPYIKRLLEATRTPILVEKGYEADDTIAAVARQVAGQNIDVYIVSSDKDLTQLVGGRVYMLNPMKNDLVYDSDVVKQVMGVAPSQMIDLLALKGDSVDNIPGAPGIGEKGAQMLIAEYGSVENLLRHASQIQRKTYRESLEQNREQILLSKKLVTLSAEAPIQFDLESLRATEPDPAALRSLYEELEFHSLLNELVLPQETSQTQSHRFETEEEFRTWLEQLQQGRDAANPASVAIALDLRSPGELLQGAIAFSPRAGEGYLLDRALLPAAKEFLEDPRQPKCVHDAKTAYKELAGVGISLEGVVDDTMLATFLADSSRVDYSLPKAVARRFGEHFEEASDNSLTRAADLTWRLAQGLRPEIDEQQLREVYETIELPLAPVLARMETAGVLLDSAALAELSKGMDAKIDELTREICELAGKPFNINSPKQLGKVLFEDLGLPAPQRRGKTKSLSTASDVLEGLAGEHAIAAKLLEHRQFSKLKGTYVDALPALVDAAGRLHTTFNPTGSGTGRISSSNPNLQNIPIRTELGRQIRAAFVAPPGASLLSADYSQIELRILAHMSGDRTLVDAFRKGEDIHTRTAAEVFHVPPLMVGPEERRRAKAVNFGIVYGLSPFGLAQQLAISQKDARIYIEAYFQLYAGVKAFIQGVTQQARRSGFSRTLFGRRRPIPDLDSNNPTARGFAERIAINSPLQGSAADLIKLAMVRIDQRLRRERLRSAMLLQVHDELLFEVPEQETDFVARLVKQEMEKVHPLDVPLVADVKAGKNWRDMKPAA